MNVGMEGSQVETPNPMASRRQADPAPAAPVTAEEVDLERVVWDPEYRNSVRHLLANDG